MLPNLLDNSDAYKPKTFFSHHNCPQDPPPPKVNLPLIQKKPSDHTHSKSFQMPYNLHWKVRELPKPQFPPKSKSKKNSWDQKHRLKTMVTKEGGNLKIQTNKTPESGQRKGLNLGKFRKIFLNHLSDKNANNQNLTCVQILPQSSDLPKKFILREKKEGQRSRGFLNKLGLPSISYSFEVICDYSSFGSAKGFSIEKQLPRKKQNSCTKQNETIDENVQPIQKRANFSIQSPLNSQDLNQQFRLKLEKYKIIRENLIKL